MKKTKSKIKNKRLITKIVTFFSLVATLVATLVVPSFAYTINEDTGSYVSQSYSYTLNRSNPIGYEVSSEECYHTEHVTYTFHIPVADIEGFPNVTYRFDVSDGHKMNYTSLGTFTSVNTDFANMFADERWGDEHYYAYLRADYIIENSFFPEEEWETLRIDLTLHVDVDSWEEDLQNYMDFYGDGGTFRVRFSPTLNTYSTKVKEIIANKQSSIDSLNSTITTLNNTIAEKDGIIADRDTTINQKDSIIAERDKTIAEMDSKYGNAVNTIDNLEAEVERLTSDNTLKDKTITQNNALRSLFNGIGNGISNLITPFLDLEFNGVTVGAVIAFVVVVLIVFIVLKFII